MEKPIVWLDTDAGDDVDDAYCIVLAALWGEIELVGVSTVHGPTLSRAKLARKLLDLCGRSDVPVYPANDRTGETPQLDWAADYPFQRPEIDAPAAIAQAAEKYAGKLTLVTIGALTNAARAFEKDPGLAGRLRRLIVMGGWVEGGRKPAETRPEYNIACDPKAAQVVFSAGVGDMIMVGLDVTMQARLEDDPWLNRIRAAGKPWTDALVELTRRWAHPVPILHDPLAFSCILKDFCTLEPMRIEIDDAGHTTPAEGQPNLKAATAVRASDFLDWYTETITSA